MKAGTGIKVLIARLIMEGCGEQSDVERCQARLRLLVKLSLRQ